MCTVHTVNFTESTLVRYESLVTSYHLPLIVTLLGLALDLSLPLLRSTVRSRYHYLCIDSIIIVVLHYYLGVLTVESRVLTVD